VSLPAEKQAITALPDIRTLTLENQDEFMVIACDGIWNFMSSQDVVDFVRTRIEKKTLAQICEEVSLNYFQKKKQYMYSYLVIYALSCTKYKW
jgi:serine/threonine protein phosphatase PrpC